MNTSAIASAMLLIGLAISFGIVMFYAGRAYQVWKDNKDDDEQDTRDRR